MREILREDAGERSDVILLESLPTAHIARPREMLTIKLLDRSDMEIVERIASKPRGGR